MDIGEIDADRKIDIILGHVFLGNKALDEKSHFF
jgi:hypothetical protein